MIFIFLYNFIYYYLIIGVIFSCCTFLYMFYFGQERKFNIKDYIYMIFYYPLIINLILKSFDNDE